jgi:DSF synthase
MTILQSSFTSSSPLKLVTDHPPAVAEVTALRPRLPADAEVASLRYENLEVELDPEARTFWGFMRSQGRGSFTPALLRDILDMQGAIRRMFAERAHETKTPFDYYVLGSRIPGTYNLGGDLGLFAEKIRTGNRAALSHYAHTCVEAVHNNHIAFDVPVITIALVQGDALGGGFECALAFDLIVAERSAKMGLPEILFNLFPGMGAYSFLSRRLDPVRAEKMILSGRIYTAEELHEMGVVDVLAEDGEGENAVREYIDRHAYRQNAYRAVFKTRRRVNPVTIEELRDVTDIWVEAALNLGESDLRRMGRLVAAQDRRRASRLEAVSLMSAE